jgi:voltage-gated potassium channel
MLEGRSRLYPSLLGILFLQTLTTSMVDWQVLRAALMLAVLTLVTWTISGSRWVRGLGALLSVSVLGLIGFETGLEVAALSLAAVYALIATGIMLTDVLAHRQVTSSTLSGALSVYLLFGLAWGLVFALIERTSPGAFRGLPADPELHSHALQYFSLVTIATLGYGDVTPVLPLAQSLVVSEALMGQLFLAVLVARLVALQLVHRDPA